MFFVDFFMCLVWCVWMSVEMFYEFNKLFCWNLVFFGWFMGLRIISFYVIGLVFIRVL